MAFIIEGRSGDRGRRRASSGSSAEYRKLKNNVEEVIPSLDKNSSPQNYIYWNLVGDAPRIWVI